MLLKQARWHSTLVALLFLLALLPVTALAAGLEAAPPDEPEAAQAAAAGYNVTPVEMNVVQIVGYQHTLALDDEGNVWGWGYNGRGELGNGTLSSKETIAKIELPGRAVEIAAYLTFSMALLEDGSVYYWGVVGAQGSDNPPVTTPTRVEGVGPVKHITTGRETAFMVAQDGTVWGWGRNLYGLLGLGHQNAVPEPVQNPYLQNVDGLYTFNFDGVVAVTEDGTRYVWGLWGQILIEARPVSGVQTTPTTQHNMPALRNISGNINAVYLVGTNNRLVVWGNNYYGQLGMGDYNDRANTAVTNPITDVKDAWSVGYAGFVVKNNGTLWSVGMNYNGLLGIGNSNTVGMLNENRYTIPSFTRVAGITGAVELSQHWYSMYVKTETGDWYGWGSNSRGSLLPNGENYPEIISPVLVFKAKPDPVQHTVTLTETWTDDSRPNRVASYTAVEGEPLALSFETPAGYTATVDSDVPVIVDYETGTITLESVTAAAAITVTYTPIEGHTVTVIVRYRDEALPEQVNTYTVPDGEAFLEGFEVLDGYNLARVQLYSLSYNVDMANKTVYISQVDQDITVLLEFEPIMYTVSVTTKYGDDPSKDLVQYYSVPIGADFLEFYPMDDGYKVANIEMSALGFDIDVSTRAIRLYNVSKDMAVTITFERV